MALLLGRVDNALPESLAIQQQQQQQRKKRKLSFKEILTAQQPGCSSELIDKHTHYTQVRASTILDKPLKADSLLLSNHTMASACGMSIRACLCSVACRDSIASMRRFVFGASRTLSLSLIFGCNRRAYTLDSDSSSPSSLVTSRSVGCACLLRGSLQHVTLISCVDG